MPLIKRISINNLIAFWLLGLCNNFAYVIMLSAAKDILEKETKNGTSNYNETCPKDEKDIKCTSISTGSVLLADILPTLFIKLLGPFFLMHIAYDIRHIIVVFFQALSYIIVGISKSVEIGLIGVVFASLGSGLGEITYLSLASHFSNNVISAYSSGTGGAGVVGALVYAAMTDPYLLNISPNKTLFFMTIVPLIFLICYSKLLKCPESANQFGIFNNIDNYDYESIQNEIDEEMDNENVTTRNEGSENAVTPLSYEEKKKIIISMLQFMLPLVVVYYAEYFINQGLLELISFTCKKGFNLTLSAQYRWYQVLYQIGVFVSRSSHKLCVVKSKFLPILSIIQIINLIIFYFDAKNHFIGHIIIVMALVLFEGTIGGKAYVSTFSQIHEKTTIQTREFSLTFVAISDSIGIVLAGFSAIPVHNYICSLK
ncbi:Battenin [Strongyloides ratti]|uniref:Battenin n=1 Tax=Strongyloides ratti TaxID=34506 RepID=A0A090LCZ9_STRRB|nr:Battenin [Strongyloides ratti]CEF67651.1 Battenin [Strongyloides ratti]